MKLVKQVLLAFQEGTSDKVYEVDLCEVSGTGGAPARYVVNFRYGRRGTALRDGTKTLAPVLREQAERIFTTLVASKVDKGYRYAAGSDTVDDVEPRPSPAAPETTVDAAELDPRAQA
ncbi:MAG: WGR domain-containing protein, partial [Candidatus Nealsonbacteria bacterium]|nr:WGR domain-containing protein [Candidatus Nealsonbacteria bacterium]